MKIAHLGGAGQGHQRQALDLVHLIGHGSSTTAPACLSASTTPPTRWYLA